jgi:DNA-binding GntR family transcriptional regulator
VVEQGVGSLGERHRRLVELVADEVRRLIVDGHWPPGQRLIETQVAEELGVSRNPVREAFRSLQAEGFIELEPRRGARVAVLSPDEAGHLFDVRGALESLAAGLAARRGDRPTIAALQAVVAEGSEAAASGDLNDLPSLNTRYHELLCEASGNPQLIATMGPLRHRIQWVYATRVRDRAPASWQEHAGIVEAVAAGDEPTARQRAADHIASAKAAFLALYDDAGAPDAQNPRTEPPSTRTTAPVT